MRKKDAVSTMHNRSGGDNPSGKADFPIAVRRRQSHPEGIRQPQAEHFLHLTERVPDEPRYLHCHKQRKSGYHR